MKNEVSAVELNLVGKQFDGHTVFENVHLSIPRGSITGIIGPNGIGKSILLRLICGLVKPSRGQVHVFGQRVGIDVDFPDKTGALIDMPGFIPEWSAYKNLKMLADISGQADKTRIQEALAITGLEKDSHQRVRNFSVGMRKRLGIAQAILEQPDLLLLDEPTDSIDQSGWKAIYEYLLELKEKGTAILLTSNKSDEINILCDQAFLLERTGLKTLSIQ